MREKKVCSLACDLQVMGITQNFISFGKSREHQPIPTGKNLVVPPRLDSTFAHGEQLPLRFTDQASHFLLLITAEQLGQLCHSKGGMKNVLVLEVPHIGDVVVAAEDFSSFIPQHLHDLIATPDKKLSFLPLGICVLSRIKSTARVQHLSLDISENLFYHLAKKWLPGCLIGLQVQTRQQRIIVEHLLKVRH